MAWFGTFCYHDLTFLSSSCQTFPYSTLISQQCLLNELIYIYLFGDCICKLKLKKNGKRQSTDLYSPFREVLPSRAAFRPSKALSMSPWTSKWSDLVRGRQSKSTLPPPRAHSHSESLTGSLSGINKAKEVSWLENLFRSERQDTKNVEMYWEWQSFQGSNDRKSN